MKKKVIYLSILIQFLVVFPTISQVIKGHTNSWFLVLNKFQLNKKWSITNELHERTGSFFHNHATFIARPSVDFNLNENVEFAIGYSFVQTSSYFPYFTPLPKIEHNVWQQVMLKQNISNTTILHRFRQENRFIDNIVLNGSDFEKNGFKYVNRFRYRITLNHEFYEFSKTNHELFAVFFDELWINQTKKLLPKEFTRNWLFLGLGYKFSENSNLQAGFMHQYDYAGASNYIESPILQLIYFKKFNC